MTRRVDRLKEIAALAEETAELFCPGGLVVDPYKVAQQLGLPVLHGDYKAAFDGLLEHRGGRFFIYCDSERLGGPDGTRTRFTVAHELGHWFIDEHRQSLAAGVSPHASFADFGTTDLIEEEAHTFAAHLLVPPNRLRRVVGSQSPELGTVLGVAKAFNISRTCAAVRYVNADLYGCAVLRLAHDGKVRWRRISDTLGDRTYRSTIADLGELGPKSTAWSRFQTALTTTDPVEGCQVEASDWFTWAKGDRNLELYLEFVSIGRYGVLAFLSTDL
jgi:hypothetical protein